jgi:hypothetical protein
MGPQYESQFTKQRESRHESSQSHEPSCTLPTNASCILTEPESLPFAARRNNPREKQEQEEVKEELILVTPATYLLGKLRECGGAIFRCFVSLSFVNFSGNK